MSVNLFYRFLSKKLANECVAIFRPRSFSWKGNYRVQFRNRLGVDLVALDRSSGIWLVWYKNIRIISKLLNKLMKFWKYCEIAIQSVFEYKEIDWNSIFNSPSQNMCFFKVQRKNCSLCKNGVKIQGKRGFCQEKWSHVKLIKNTYYQSESWTNIFTENTEKGIKRSNCIVFFLNFSVVKESLAPLEPIILRSSKKNFFWLSL